jgi:heat shock protein HslJ
MIRHGKRILIVIASVGVIACTSRPPSGQSARRSLRGVRWELVDVAGRPVVGDVEHRPYLELAPDSARFAGSTGCNRLTGPFTFTGATIHFGAAATTRMACLDAAINQQEQALLAALSETDSYQIVNDTLQLARGAATLARFAAAAPR